MEYSPKQDFGNLGNLVVYLNGKQNILDRLEIGKKIFYISLNVPPQHKEEVIMVWLMDILSTNKVLTFNDEEVILIWKTLREFCSSKRLKALCLTHWICPVTPPFVQTLLATCTNSPTEIQNEALSICECFLNMFSFSPQIMMFTKQSFRLLNTVLKLILQTKSFDTSQSFIILLLKKVTFIFDNEMIKANSMSLVFEKQASNLFHVLLELKTKNSLQHRELIKEMETFLHFALFSHDCIIGYSMIFELTMCKIYKNTSINIGESFYSFIIALLTENDKEKAAYILREFYICFSQAFRKSEELVFKIIIITMALLGVSYESGLKFERDNSVSISLIPVKLKNIHKHMFIASILEGVHLAELNVEINSSDVIFKDWLKTLFKELVTQKDHNEHSLKCLSIIIRMDNDLISEFFDLIGNLLLVNRNDDNIYKMIDEIFCIILSLNLKRRNFDELFEKISHTVLLLDENELPKTLLNNDIQTPYLRKKSFLPNKFLKKLYTAIGTMEIIKKHNVWNSIHEILSTCHIRIQTHSTSESFLKVSYVIWFSSFCLAAASVTKNISSSRSISKVISAIDSFASDCIEPLVMDLKQIKHEGSSYLLQSLMNLILVWSEIYGTLFIVCNEKQMRFSSKFEIKEDDSKNLKSLIPFMDQIPWEEFSYLSEEKDAGRSLIIQLLIQKLSISVLRESETRVCKSSKKSFFIVKIIDYMLNTKDESNFSISSDIFAVHLPTLMPLMKKRNFDTLARYFIHGVEENKEPWIKFSKSQMFLENEMFQIRIFSNLCSSLSALLSGKKRKLDDDSSEELPSKFQNVSSKLLNCLISIQEKNFSHLEFEKDIALIFTDLDTLIKFSTENCLKSRNEKKILAIFQTLEILPLLFLEPRFLMSVLTLTVIVARNVGGISAQKKIGLAIINVLNCISSASNLFYVFKLCKKRPHFLLSWLLHECHEMVNHSRIDECHLDAVLLMKERLNSPQNSLHGLLNVIWLFTQSFVQWNESGLHIKSYIDEIVNLSTETESTDASYLTTSILICSIEKNIKGKMTETWLDLLKTLCSWTTKSAKKMILSNVTKAPFACVLLTYCQAMMIEISLQDECSDNKKKENFKASKLKTTSKGDQKNCVTSVLHLPLDWDALIETGLTFATLAFETEDENLRKLALDFYLSVSKMSSYINNIDMFNLPQRIWQIIFTGEVYHMQEEKFFKILSPKHNLIVLKILVEEVKAGDANLPKLLQWLSAFIKNIQGKKNSPLFDELVVILTVKFSEVNSFQLMPSYYIQLLKLLILLFETKLRISINAKSLVMGLISNCSFKDVSTSECTEILQLLAKLLSIVLFKEYHLMSKKPSCFLSAFTNIITILLSNSEEKKWHNDYDLKGLQKCCYELEKVSKILKEYSRDIFKIAAFSLSSILEEMQQNRIVPTVKVSVERIIYTLIDMSDPYTLKYILVTLPPSAVTLLQHFHKSYSQSFQFDPRKT